MPGNHARGARAQRRRDILACAPDIFLQHRGVDTCGQIARHLGLSTSGLRAHVRNEADLIRLLCQAHLNDIFGAVCRSTGGGALPPDALIAMAQALLGVAASNAARHRIYLLHRFMLGEENLHALAALRSTIDNSFHFVLHAAAPQRPFCGLRLPARLLVGELLHAPLWWPEGIQISQARWLAQTVGFAGVFV